MRLVFVINKNVFLQTKQETKYDNEKIYNSRTTTDA